MSLTSILGSVKGTKLQSDKEEDDEEKERKEREARQEYAQRIEADKQRTRSLFDQFTQQQDKQKMKGGLRGRSRTV